MAAPIIIKLTTTGPSITGPFSIYCTQAGSPVNPPLITGITKAQLLAGYYMVLPTGCTGVRVLSNGVDCTNYIDFSLPTTSTTTSTTTTTLPPCKCHQVIIVGTVTISYTGCDNTPKDETYSDVSVKICARVGSVIITGTGSAIVTPLSTTCVEEVDCWDAFIMDVNLLSTIYFQIAATGRYAIEWSPGVYDFYNAHTNTTRSHTYPGPYTGQVKIKAPSLTFIDRLTFTTGSVAGAPSYLNINGPEIAKLTKLTVIDIGYGCGAHLYCDTSDLSPILTKLRIYKGILTGDIANLAPTITDLAIYGNSTVYGDIQNLPPNLTLCDIYGTNNVNGDLANLPPSLQSTLKVFRIEGSNDVTGDIGALGGFLQLEIFRFLGDNTITGDIAGIATLIKMKTFDIYGKNRLLGNISAISGWIQCTRFTVGNPYPSFGTIGNELTGDLSSIPASMLVFRVYKYNTIGGDLSSLPANISDVVIIQVLSSPANITGNLSSITSCPLTVLILQGGSFTFTGDITDLPLTLTDCWLDTSGVITGDLALLGPNITSFSVYNTNVASSFTYTPGRVWATPMRTLDIQVASAVPKIPTVDNLLIDLSASTWVSVTLPSTYGLKLKGPLVSPAAIAAKNTIQATPTNVVIY